MVIYSLRCVHVLGKHLCTKRTKNPRSFVVFSQFLLEFAIFLQYVPDFFVTLLLGLVPRLLAHHHIGRLIVNVATVGRQPTVQ